MFRTTAWRTGLLAMAFCVWQAGAFGQQAPDALATGFQSPPDSAKPQVWWHWMNGNVSKAGITLDLEAMKRVGLGGVHIAHVGSGVPKGAIPFDDPRTTELERFAIKEADRLGLDLVLFNCPGWSSSGGPWVKPENSMKVLTLTETTAAGGKLVSMALEKPAALLDFYKDAYVVAFPTPAGEGRVPFFNNGVMATRGGRGGRGAAAEENVSAIEQGKVMDLTGKMDAQGKLTWDAPAGNWTILRIGFTSNGTKNKPAPEGGSGLEIDKFSKEALDAHFESFCSPFYEVLKPLAAKGKAGALIDSFEVGNQNWTDKFPEEFKKRRGYDMAPFMPVMAAGRVVGSLDISQRFLWDVRKTEAEVMADNYYTHFAELCHQHGMYAITEPYKTSNFDEMSAGLTADVPMAEFWQGPTVHNSVKLVASVTHMSGKPVMESESFTSRTRWTETPYALKSMGDYVWTMGINRLVLHEYALQPNPDPLVGPGTTLGQYGGHFNRNNTWWEQSTGWMSYMARSQFLLQQGLFVGDVAYFCGEDSPVQNPDPSRLIPAPPAGHAVDTIDPVTMKTRVKIVDGKITLPDGMTYRVFVLPGTAPTMTLETIQKLRDLVNDGMTLVVAGPGPKRTASLMGYPNADGQVAKLAGEIWGNLNGTTVMEHTLGKGRVCWGIPLAVVLEDKVGAKRDFQMTSRSGNANINYIHRRIPAALPAAGAPGTDIYFVANRGQKPEDLVCIFNVEGKHPEFWDSTNGQRMPVAIYDTANHQTRVPMQLEPSGSMFVVFRDAAPAAAPHFVSLRKGDTMLAGVDPLLDATRPLDLVQAIPEGEGGPAGNGNATPLPLPPAPPLHSIELTGGPKGEFLAWEDGTYTLRNSKGQDSEIRVTGTPTPREIAGPWHVTFPPKRGAPAEATFEKLTSWSENADQGIKYFSGTATYTNTFAAALDGSADSSTRMFLDLQRVQVVAEVIVNGKNQGIVWKLPFRIDITDAVHRGSNELVVKVTNLWPNRLIGDEQLPPENEWIPGGSSAKPIGARLVKIPDWYLQNLPKPVGTGRLTFATWSHWKATDKLLESGLMGPVVLRSATRVAVTK